MRTFSLKLAVLLFVLLVACKKDKQEPQTSEAPSPVVPAYYIKGEMDGQAFNYSYSGAQDTIHNFFLSYLHEGQLTMSRAEKKGGNSIWITMETYRYLDSIALPANYPNSDYGLVFYWHNFEQRDSITLGQFEYTIRDSSWKFSLVSIVNDVLKGTFSGKLKNNNNEVKTFTNGEFQIKIYRRAVR